MCLCLALPDAKVNNQSETTKCAMESGDGNTGEWSTAFFPLLLFFLYRTEIRMCWVLSTHSTGLKFLAKNLHFCSANLKKLTAVSLLYYWLIKKKKKARDGSFPKSLWAVLFVKLSVYLTGQFPSLVPIEYHTTVLRLSDFVMKMIELQVNTVDSLQCYICIVQWWIK